MNKNFNFLTQQKLLKKYLFRPWRITKEKKPSTYLRNIQNEVSEVNTRILNSFVSLFPDIFLFIVIIVLLLSYSPEITLTLFGIMAVIGILTNKYFDKKISKLASNRMIITKINYSYLIEMMKFLKKIIIFKKQSFFYEKYKKKNLSYNNIIKDFSVINSLPSINFELLGSVLIILTIFIAMSFNYSNEKILITVSLIVISMSRLLPSAIRIIRSLQNIRLGKPAVDNLYNELKKNTLNDNKNYLDNYVFNKNINIKNVYFKYKNNKSFTLNNINLKIERNSAIAIIGKSVQEKVL